MSTTAPRISTVPAHLNNERAKVVRAAEGAGWERVISTPNYEILVSRELRMEVHAFFAPTTGKLVDAGLFGQGNARRGYAKAERARKDGINPALNLVVSWFK